jgi:hypothetical protein
MSNPKGDSMISSPCKQCYRLYLPKEECLEDCKLLKGIQNLQFTMPKMPYSSIDSTDPTRYRLALPTGTQMYE